MIFNCTQPIKVVFNNITGISNQYLNYNIQVSYYDTSTESTEYKNLFNGKTWVDSDGNTTIEISSIMRDYSWRWTYDVDENQQYKPKMLVSNTDTIQPLEANENVIMNGYVKVSLTVPSTAVATKTIEVASAYVPLYQTKVNDIYNPFDETDLIHKEIFYNQTGVLPHLPLVFTDRYWFGLVFGINANNDEGDLDFTYTTKSQSLIDGYKQLHSGYGNYAMAITLDDFYRALRGGIFTKFNPSQIELNGTPVAIVDTDCAMDYYVSWIAPSGQWMSWGFNGQHTVNSETDNNVIATLQGDDYLLWNNERIRYSLYCNNLSKKEYEMLQSIPYSPKVYIYDTNRDLGCYCTTATNGVEGWKKTDKRKSISFDFYSIRYNIR